MSTRDQLELAKIMGCVSRHAARQAGERAHAVDEVRRAARGRADLLGQAAGTYRAQTLSGDRAFWYSDVATRLCVDAGADVDVARRATAAAAVLVQPRRRGPAGGPTP
ncbi:hypothetical protein [Tersicoccus sp. Bi-70]|uniref:hypothetical protein n=1 Tax=Tersicoccus sp. Bi-70 TaxID=1897634 RepID=UPI00117C8F75|nr:hypothetical protein [Tersicoccus sp. Bi-70]